MPNSFYRCYGKRSLDALASFCGLVLLFPVFALVAIAIRLETSGPCFFRQVRSGRDGRPFHIFKFRSMRVSNSTAAPLITAAGDPRITRTGRLLRKTKVDELPQLINVLLGDMSLVGPRPEVPKYTETYSAAQRQVLSVRPGITGPTALACIHEEEILAQQPDPEHFYKQSLLRLKLELDLSYCENIRLSSDLSLIAQTAGRMFARGRSKSTLIQTLLTKVEDFQA